MSICRHISSYLLIGVAAVGLAVIGCRKEPSGGSTTAARPGPEESFAGIVQFARRQIETGAGAMPPGFVITGEGGRRSQFVVRNDVTSEFIPPTTEGEPYRGTITVTSSSTFSVRRTESSDKADEGSGGHADRNAEQRRMFDESDSDDSSIDILDEDLVSSTSHSTEDADAAGGEPTTVVQRHREEPSIRTFEFEYENGRWVLKTEPDPETERAIKRAFDRALQLQP